MYCCCGCSTCYCINWENRKQRYAIIASGAELKELFNGAHFTEGVSVAPDGTVYFSDITFTYETDMQAGNIWKHNPETGERQSFSVPQAACPTERSLTHKVGWLSRKAQISVDAGLPVQTWKPGKSEIHRRTAITGNRLTHRTISQSTNKDASISRIHAMLEMNPSNNPFLVSIASIQTVPFTSSLRTQANPTVWRSPRIRKPFTLLATTTARWGTSPDEMPNRARETWHSSPTISHPTAQRLSEKHLLTTHQRTVLMEWLLMLKEIFSWQCAMKPKKAFTSTHLKAKNWRTLRHRINPPTSHSDAAKRARRSILRQKIVSTASKQPKKGYHLPQK